MSEKREKKHNNTHPYKKKTVVTINSKNYLYMVN